MCRPSAPRCSLLGRLLRCCSRSRSLPMLLLALLGVQSARRSDGSSARRDGRGQLDGAHGQTHTRSPTSSHSPTARLLARVRIRHKIRRDLDGSWVSLFSRIRSLLCRFEPSECYLQALDVIRNGSHCSLACCRCCLIFGLLLLWTAFQFGRKVFFQKFESKPPSPPQQVSDERERERERRGGV